MSTHLLKSETTKPNHSTEVRPRTISHDTSKWKDTIKINMTRKKKTNMNTNKIVTTNTAMRLRLIRNLSTRKTSLPEMTSHLKMFKNGAARRCTQPPNLHG